MLEEADINDDDIVSEQELELYRKATALENRDKKEDAQRNMAWFALLGMLLYPFAILFANYVNLVEAAEILGNMAPTYFVSVAAIMAAFYGKEAYVNRNADQSS